MSISRVFPQTLLQSLEQAAHQRGCGFRFLDHSESATELSYEAILARSHRVASRLLGLGLQRGERVALILPTCPEFATSFFGCLLAGGIPVPLYPPLRLGSLTEYKQRTLVMLRAVDVSCVLWDSRCSRVLRDLFQTWIPTRGIHIPVPWQNSQISPISLASETVHPDDVALIQFSSGTTQSPSPVALTHRQILSNIQAMIATFPPAQPYHRGVCWLPLYHDMGLIGCFLTSVVLAAPQTFLPPELFLARPVVWLQAISRYQATISPAPNFAYARCVEKIKEEDMVGVDLSSWQLALNGAEPVSVNTMTSFQRRFADWGFRPEALTPVYGLAEASLAVTFSSIMQPFRVLRVDRTTLEQGNVAPSKDTAGRVQEEASQPDTPSRDVALVSVGSPLANMSIQIRDPQTGNSLPAGRVGQIWVSGPSLADRYWEQTEPLLQEGWLNTGDLGFLWENELYITGRAKDLVIVRGRNIMPHEIERACDSVSGVRPGCQVAVSELHSEGERLYVFVEYRDVSPDLEQRCRRAIVQATGVEPDTLVLLPPSSLPRTSSGKMRRQETLQRWKNGTLKPTDSPVWNLFKAWVRRVWNWWFFRRSE